jgi:hypothetical protein
MRAFALTSLAMLSAVVLSLGCRRDPPPDGQPAPTTTTPSAEVSAAIVTGDLLVHGPTDVAVVPFGWKLVDASGKQQEIPTVPGTKYHRLPANRALLATDGNAADKGESMLLASFHSRGPVTASMLDRYAEQVAKSAPAGTQKKVEAKQMFTHTTTREPRGKLFVSRMPADGRHEIHYLFTDRAHETWQLVYLVRNENVDTWRTVLAELD